MLFLLKSYMSFFGAFIDFHSIYSLLKHNRDKLQAITHMRGTEN
jgi:hypothetical protein